MKCLVYVLGCLSVFIPAVVYWSGVRSDFVSIFFTAGLTADILLYFSRKTGAPIW